MTAMINNTELQNEFEGYVEELRLHLRHFRLCYQLGDATEVEVRAIIGLKDRAVMLVTDLQEGVEVAEGGLEDFRADYHIWREEVA